MALELISDPPPDAEQTESKTQAVPTEPATAKKTARRKKTPKKKKRRGRSTVSFPYGDLGDAEKVARQVFNRGGTCSIHELAASLGHDTVHSGALRNKTSAGRMFGLIEGAGETISLTPLGRQLLDAETERPARVKAFLNVDLYSDLFHLFRGGLLPPDSGIEQAMVRLGVTSTQAARARQIFQRSAELAGFYEAGADRLVQPTGAAPQRPNTDPKQAEPQVEPSMGGRGASNMQGLPKLIEGLLEEAPWGKSWNEDEFKEWTDLFERAARVHFKLPRKGGAV